MFFSTNRGRIGGCVAITTALIREPMTLNEFTVGQEFWCGDKKWRCTDVGSRVVVAVCVTDNEHDPSWLNGPPYACVESVFDEYDQKGCYVEQLK